MGTKVIDARDLMIDSLIKLEPGSEEALRQTQAIKNLSDIDREDRKLEFDIDKEETRKVEKSNETVYAQFDMKLRKYDLILNGIKIVGMILDPAGTVKTIMNNSVKVKRDIMGYTFEETGVIGSHTFNNAQKDKYD